MLSSVNDYCTKVDTDRKRGPFRGQEWGKYMRRSFFIPSPHSISKHFALCGVFGNIVGCRSEMWTAGLTLWEQYVTVVATYQPLSGLRIWIDVGTLWQRQLQCGDTCEEFILKQFRKCTTNDLNHLFDVCSCSSAKKKRKHLYIYFDIVRSELFLLLTGTGLFGLLIKRKC